MSSSSRSIASFANPAGEEGSIQSPMSRSSEAASKLGRLTLAGSDMPVRTRGQARVEEQQLRQQASGGARQSSGRGSRQSKATAGPSRSSRTARRGKEREEEEDSDDDDDDDADGDDDGAGNGGGSDPASPPETPETRILRIMSIYDPNNRTYDELVDRDLRDSARRDDFLAESVTFRDQMMALARAANNHGAQFIQQFERLQPLGSAQWSKKRVETLATRMNSIFHTLDTSRPPNVLAAVREVRRYFTAVENVLRRPDDLDRSYHATLIGYLRWVLANVVERDANMDSETPYAGGRYENNLYYRFASNRDWEPCLEVIRRLASRGYAQYFRSERERVAWGNMYNVLIARHSAGSSDPNIMEFGSRLRRTLQNLSIIPQDR